MRAFEGLAAPDSVATPVGRLSTMPAYEINARVLTIVANDDGVGSRLLHRSIAASALCQRILANAKRNPPKRVSDFYREIVAYAILRRIRPSSLGMRSASTLATAPTGSRSRLDT